MSIVVVNQVVSNTPYTIPAGPSGGGGIFTGRAVSSGSSVTVFVNGVAVGAADTPLEMTLLSGWTIHTNSGVSFWLNGIIIDN